MGDNTLIMEFHFLSTFHPEKGHPQSSGDGVPEVDGNSLWRDSIYLTGYSLGD